MYQVCLARLPFLECAFANRPTVREEQHIFEQAFDERSAVFIFFQTDAPTQINLPKVLKI